MKTILIKPLRQEVIRVDVLRPHEDVVLDKLNTDLSFKKEVARLDQSTDLQQALNYFCDKGKAKPGGWIPVQCNGSMPEAFKTAMQKLQSSKLQKV